MKHQVPFIRTEYNYDMSAASKETEIICNGKCHVQQSAKEEVDINTIVRRFGLTGQLPDALRAPSYGDFTGVTDYHSALNAVIAADDAFMEMPAEIRARFHNDAGAFVDFCSNPENAEEMKKMHLTRVVDAPIMVNVGNIADLNKEHDDGDEGNRNAATTGKGV